MIEPVLRDDAFLADVAGARAGRAPDRLFLWWLGQSGFLICHRGECLVFDPYLSDALTKKYAATDKPHVRMTARVVEPARLDFVGVVTSSHTHTDHLDAETLGPLLAAAGEAKLVLPLANVSVAIQRLGASVADRLIPVAGEGRVTLGPFKIEAVPAAHEELLPEFTGFLVTVGGFRIYHSGDTVHYPGMEARLKPHQIDVALLPINGAAPERRVAGNLNGAEAAQLARAIGARFAVPCHYDMFEFNTATPMIFAGECARLGQNCAILRAGERCVLTQEGFRFHG